MPVYHGIERSKIPWNPKIDYDKCINCGTCVEYCKLGTYVTVEEHEEKKEGYVRREYSSSSYYRTFKLPENVDEEKIDATLDNGVLKLDLPKKVIEEKEKKQIEIK